MLITGMADLGKINELSIEARVDHGLSLDGGEDGPILLPNRYVTREMAVGGSVTVFVHTDSKDRLVATTETPLVQAGEFARLKVLSIDDRAGAFLDWGLSKDLLLPFREQGSRRVRPGQWVVVAVYVDEHTQRIVASMRLQRHFPQEVPEYEPNQAVQALVYGQSPLGYKVVVDRKYGGLLYQTETADELRAGDEFTGYVKKVRSGGKIDLWRDPAGYERVESVTEKILAQLSQCGGILPYNDKTSPDVIRRKFDTSKKAFKQALGALYKQRKIRFTEDGIERI